MIRRVEVVDRKIRHHSAKFMVSLDPLAELGGTVVTDTRNGVDLLDEDAVGLIADEVRGGVVDRVARSAAHSEELRLGLVPVADVGDVLIAEGVDLTGAHDHVAATAPKSVEHGTERDPALDLLVGPTDGEIVGHEEGFAVAHEKVGFEGGAGEPSPEHGDGAHSRREDLAIAAERVGDCDDADLTEGCIAHRAATAF